MENLCDPPDWQAPRMDRDSCLQGSGDPLASEIDRFDAVTATIVVFSVDPSADVMGISGIWPGSTSSCSERSS